MTNAVSSKANGKLAVEFNSSEISVYLLSGFPSLFSSPVSFAKAMISSRKSI